MEKQSVPKEFFDFGDYGHVCKKFSDGELPPVTDPLWSKNPEHNIMLLHRLSF